MENLFLWAFLAYGITNILVYGTIFNGPREVIFKLAQNEKNPFQGFFLFVKNMISCMMCCSTWVGFFLGLLLYSPTWEYLDVTEWVSWFYDGLFASGVVWTINSIVEWFEVNRPK